MKTNKTAVIPDALLQVLHQQGVIAYPTEAVFGLGCSADSDIALQRLLTLKQRPWQKGLILVAANYQQLQPYLDQTQLTEQHQQILHRHWPGPITYVLPAAKGLSPLLIGEHQNIAVRVSAHLQVQQLCLAWGKPLVSTSANLSGQAACRTIEQVKQQFGDDFPVLAGQVDKRANPSMIVDMISGQVLRPS